jgi:hypothetical protein
VAHTAYYNKEGKRLPSVTTVIGGSLGWNKEVLMKWAHRQGKEGKEFRETTQKAADAGTIAHAMCEEYINKRDWKLMLLTSKDPEVLAFANRSFKAFKRFERSSGLVYVATECSLVSEEWQYGGTLDAVATVEDDDSTLEHILIDFKTCNATYVDHLIQLAAYKQLWEENYPDKKLEGGIYLARFSKINGMVTTHNYPDGVLDPAWTAFSHLRALHNQRWSLESLTK